jgi:hypothetical protein
MKNYSRKCFKLKLEARNDSLERRGREMKKFLAVIMFSLLLIPFATYAESEQQASQPPSVAAPLIREGDFAIKLAGALNLGTAKDDMEAQSLLVAVGIAPRNGWISDYPVTPDILAEIQKAVEDAADANRLPLGKNGSLRALQDVQTSLELAFVPDTSGKYAEAQPPTAPEYTDPSVINDYYYSEGPPIVTYYPPPVDYYYLYAWVPSPFWYTGFFFPGYFILHDFHHVVFFHNRRHVFSNHVFDRGHRRFFRVDHVRRFHGSRDFLRDGGRRFEAGGFRSGHGRRGAEAILQRSRERMISSRNPNAIREGFRGGRGGPERSFGASRSFGAPGRNEGRSFSGPMRGEGRSFNSPPARAERRSFNSPTRSEGRSFSRSPMGGRSFTGAFREGGRGISRGSFGAFRSGGFAGRGSFGGFRGGGGGFRHGGGGGRGR